MSSHDLGEVETESVYEVQAGLELLIRSVSQVLAGQVCVTSLCFSTIL